MKTERLSALEIDKKRMLETEKSLNKNLDDLR
jgi:hypothetical protein